MSGEGAPVSSTSRGEGKEAVKQSREERITEVANALVVELQEQGREPIEAIFMAKAFQMNAMAMSGTDDEIADAIAQLRDDLLKGILPAQQDDGGP